MSIRIKLSILWSVAAALLAGCAATTLPPLPAGNPADPQVRVPEKPPANLLAHDETTVAIAKELSGTQAQAEASQKMEHDMQNMPGMQNMSGMEHGGMKMEGQGQMQPDEMKMEGHQEKATEIEPEKKALADEMKKTSDEMKRTSDAMKQESEQKTQQNFYFTCPMHPQIHADKPGKCPICGMTLIKKEGAAPK